MSMVLLICTKCGYVGPEKDWVSDPRRSTGRMSECRTCSNKRKAASRLRHLEKNREKGRKGYWANREQRLDYCRFRNYGVTPEQYHSMIEKQRNRCAICGTDRAKPNVESKWHVDHDHTTGTVRGLLCYKCNSVLGYANNSPTVLIKAAEYLQAFGSQA